MPTYLVTVHETMKYVYEIEAESEDKARAIWEETVTADLTEAYADCLYCGIEEVDLAPANKED